MRQDIEQMAREGFKKQWCWVLTETQLTGEFRGVVEEAARCCNLRVVALDFLYHRDYFNDDRYKVELAHNSDRPPYRGTFTLTISKPSEVLV